VLIEHSKKILAELSGRQPARAEVSGDQVLCRRMRLLCLGLIMALLLGGCGTVSSIIPTTAIQTARLNEASMVACKFAAEHHPALITQAEHKTRGDASASTRRLRHAAAQDCHRQLSPEE